MASSCSTTPMRVRNQRWVLWSAGSTPQGLHHAATAVAKTLIEESRPWWSCRAPFGPSSTKTSPFCTFEADVRARPSCPGRTSTGAPRSPQPRFPRCVLGGTAPAEKSLPCHHSSGSLPEVRGTHRARSPSAYERAAFTLAPDHVAAGRRAIRRHQHLVEQVPATAATPSATGLRRPTGARRAPRRSPWREPGRHP